MDERVKNLTIFISLIYLFIFRKQLMFWMQNPTSAQAERKMLIYTREKIICTPRKVPAKQICESKKLKP